LSRKTRNGVCVPVYIFKKKLNSINFINTEPMSILYLTHKSLKIRQILKFYIYNFSVNFIVG